MKMFLKTILVISICIVTVNLGYAQQSIQKINQPLKIEKQTGPQAVIQDSPYSINPVGQNQFKAFTSLLTQDFSSATFPPTGWTRTIISGPLTWTRGTSLTLGYNTLSSLGSTFSNGYAIANSDALGGTIAENCVLTSPVINCTGKPYVWLKFNEFFRLFTVGHSTGHVEVSNNGSTWTTVYSAETGLILNQSTANPHLEDVDISSVAANQATVYVRFHWTGQYDYYWVVDDIDVYSRPQYDATFSARTNMNEYSAVPLVHYNSNPIALAATAKNVGGSTLTGVNMGVTVYNGDTWSPLYTATSNTVASVAANATGSLSVTNYTPPAGLGFYVGEYVVHSQQTDADLLNDTLQQGFWINDSIYSRDDAIFTGYLDGSLGTTSLACIMGQNYQIQVSDKLKSVSCYVTGAVTGDQTQVVVYNTSSNLPTTQIASSLLYTFPTTASQWVNLPITGGPLTLAPGTYFIGIRQISTVNNLGLGYTNNNFTSNKVYVKIDTDPWDTLSVLGYNVSFLVRPKLVCGTYKPTITAPQTSFCQGSPLTLTSSPGTSYLWSPGGLTTQAINVTAGGSYTVSVTNSDGCSAISNPVVITMFPKPTVTLGTFTDKCIDAPSFALSGGTPAGGVYSGVGVSSGIFFPSIAGTGVHNIIYSYTDGNFCSNSDTNTITVHALPIVDVTPFSPVCQGASAFTLTHGTPAAGTYSGTGVSGGSFDPTVAGLGTHLITYNYTDGFGCSNSDTSSITVLTNITVTLASFASTCINTSSFALTGGTPAGGVYSGTGVSGGNFNPSVSGIGTFTITYTYTSGSCTNFATQNITVNNIPTVGLGTFADVCSNGPSFALTGGTPTGGTYSGTGVSGGNFNPATAGAGTFPITYTYTDGNSCSAQASQNIVVHSAPIAGLASFADVCIDATTFPLNGGSPLGGTYSGPGVSGGNFNPAAAGAGTHTIIYTYTDVNTCTDSASNTITVYSYPVVILTMPDTFQCINYPAVTLTGNPAGGTYSGAGVTGNQFNPATAGVGTHQLIYTYANGGICAASDTIIAFVDLCTGIEQSSATSDLISIVPNPNAGTFTIINPNAPNGTTFEIYNVLGKVVYSKQVMKYSQTIDLTGMGVGVYFMTCTHNDVRITKKIVVSR